MIKAIEVLAKLSEPIAPTRNAYFKTIIEFLKWTTTFSFAALIWISTNISNTAVSPILLQLSLICLFFSISVSVFIVYAVLYHLGEMWNNPLNFFNSAALKICDKMDRGEEEAERLLTSCVDADMYRNSLIKKIIPQSPYHFNFLLLGHLMLLLIGSLFYIAALFYIA